MQQMVGPQVKDVDPAGGKVAARGEAGGDHVQDQDHHRVDGDQLEVVQRFILTPACGDLSSNHTKNLL